MLEKLRSKSPKLAHFIETYCYDCRQLRLWCRPEKPVACGNCGSSEIEVDEVDSPRLSKLRFGPTAPGHVATALDRKGSDR